MAGETGDWVKKTTYKSNFISNFNLGRNIVSNVESLSVLYEVNTHLNSDQLNHIVKPKIVIIGSILEAILYDFARKPNLQPLESKKFLNSIQIKNLRSKNTDVFKELIGVFRANNLFKFNGVGFYESLDRLRVLRNRIHIQNTKKELEEYESEAFTDDRLIESERSLEVVIKRMLELYDRGPSFAYVDDFELPWKSHLDTSTSAKSRRK